MLPGVTVPATPLPVGLPSFSLLNMGSVNTNRPCLWEPTPPFPPASMDAGTTPGVVANVLEAHSGRDQATSRNAVTAGVTRAPAPASRCQLPGAPERSL
jgi:hypothetical protein